LWSYVEPDPRWRERPETDEFQLAGYPFVTVEDFVSLSNGGLLDAWKWIMQGGSTAARESRDALECFETAMSIGGARGGIAPELQEGWLLIGLMTTLEAIFCGPQYREDRVQRVRDGVYRFLRATGLDNTQALERTEVVRLAAHARNEVVHAGKADFDSGTFSSLPSVVADVLREAIIRRMATGS
jgi:hypothetical protein